MQASKIQVEGIYGIHRREEGASESELVRFQVTAVVTRRERNTGSPHDYKSVVEGVILEDPADENGRRPLRTVAPDKVLGPYEEQAVLVERAKAEKAEREEAERQARLDADTLLAKLYRLANLPMPNDMNTRRIPFRTSFGVTIDISREGVQALLKALKS